MVLLTIDNLTKRFAVRHGLFEHSKLITAVESVSLEIHAGECLALVGETGSGKSTFGKCVVRLLRPDAGRILYQGDDLCQLSDKQFRPLRREFQMIFQDPVQALNPRQSVGACLTEVIKVHRRCARRDIPQHVDKLLALVGLKSELAGRLPHQLSGGQRQRVAIARALAVEPAFLVADEPTSSLDATLRRQILDLLLELQQRLGLTLLLISHDLAAVRSYADRIAVMLRGRLVEVAATEALLRAPVHSYTRALLASAQRGPERRAGPMKHVVVVDETPEKTA